MQWSLSIAGFACLAWVAWTITDARLYQASAEAELAATAESAAAAADAVATASAPVVWAQPGDPIALLRVPRLDLSTVVAEGTAPAILRRAVGRLVTGAQPGEPGNLVLAGHRDTFFRPLEQIRPGDLVVLERGSESEVYTVEWTRVVEPDEMAVARATAYQALTLITCYPFRYVGQAPQRFVVRARR